MLYYYMLLVGFKQVFTQTIYFIYILNGGKRREFSLKVTVQVNNLLWNHTSFWTLTTIYSGAYFLTEEHPHYMAACSHYTSTGRWLGHTYTDICQTTIEKLSGENVYSVVFAQTIMSL